MVSTRKAGLPVAVDFYLAGWVISIRPSINIHLLCNRGVLTGQGAGIRKQVYTTGVVRQIFLSVVRWKGPLHAGIKYW